MNQWMVVCGIGVLVCVGASGCLKPSSNQPTTQQSGKPAAAQQAAPSEHPSEHPTEHPSEHPR
jgi:hypothetical protein